MIIFTLNSFQINYTLLSRALKESEKSRGLSIGAYSLCGSCGVILIDKLGGYLFKFDSSYPFDLSIASYSLFTILIIALALCK